VLTRVRLILVHFASNGIGFLCESGASIKPIGLPYELGLDEGRVVY
jgi:hypothetical protein